ncbi:hypothetical protein D3C75_978120 [compost metagenome]
MYRLVQQRLQTEQPGHLRQSAPHNRRRIAQILHREGQFMPNRVHYNLRIRVLKDHPDIPGSLLRRQLRQRLPFITDHTAACAHGCKFTLQMTQQRCFSAARRAQQHNELPFFYCE